MDDLIALPGEARQSRRLWWLFIVVPPAVFAEAFIGFGVVDLAAGIMPGEGGNHVMNVGYGLLVGLLIPMGLLGQLHPRARRVALQQTLIVWASIALAFLIGTRYDSPFGLEGGPVGFLNVLIIGLPVLMVWMANPVRSEWKSVQGWPPRALLSWWLLGCTGWIIYAAAMAAGQWQETNPYDAARNGYGGWTGLCAFSLAMAFLSFRAIMIDAGARFALVGAMLSAAVFSPIAAVYPHEPGSPGVAGGAAILAWTVGLVMLATWARTKTLLPGERAT